MDLWGILANDRRQIVHSDEDRRLLYIWNQKLTLLCYRELSPGEYGEIGVRTLEKLPLLFEEAKREAIRWASEQ